MKELRLPKALAVRFHLDGEEPKTSSSGSPPLDDLSVIEKNGAELITATVMLEERIIEAVGKLIFRG